MDNDWKSRLRAVYSTNPDYNFSESEQEQESVAPSAQDLRIWLDKKHRAGKVATIVRGFKGSESELKELGKLLKSKCGVGGSAKDGEIIIQGDHRDRVTEILINSGFRCKKAGG
ncbi:MAG: translation initiation factor [Rikenellaceae bacterium]